MPDYDAIAAELKAARQELLDVYVQCSVLVDVRAAAGDTLAVFLAEKIAAASARVQRANLEAQLSLPSAPRRV